jgi:hypothetical protein
MTSPRLLGSSAADLFGDEPDAFPADSDEVFQFLLGEAVVEIVDDRLVQLCDGSLVALFGAVALGEGCGGARLPAGHSPEYDRSRCQCQLVT